MRNLTFKEQEEFVWEEYFIDSETNIDYYHIDTIHLEMDSHGCNCKLFVFTEDDDSIEKEDRKYFAFIYRCSSEECFYEDKEIYEVEEKPVLKIEYTPVNYPEWQL